MPLSITAANVVPQTGYTKVQGVAGATITAGMPIYKDSADNHWKKTDASAVNTALCGGVAVCGAASGQPLTIATHGPVTIGATMVAGEWYFSAATSAGDTAGQIVGLTELAGESQVHALVGYAASSTVLYIIPQSGGAIVDLS